jgi:hypothetical protein
MIRAREQHMAPMIGSTKDLTGITGDKDLPAEFEN